MAFNTQEQEIIKWGLDNGKNRQEVEQAIVNFRSGIVPQPKPVKEPGFLQGLKTDLNTRVDRTGGILNREDSSVAEKGLQVFGQGAGLAANAIEKTAEQIPGVKQAFGAIGSGIQWLATSDFSPAKMLGDQIGKSKALQEVTMLYDTDQNFKDSVDAVANIARLGGDVQMAVDATKLTKNALSKLADKTKSILPPAGGSGGGGGALSVASDNALAAGLKLKDSVQLTIAKKNVSPQLESSANRLFLDGTKNLESPLATYDNYLAQSKKAIGDIKADPAIAVVGEKMGDAFQTVIKQRQAVGKVLGDELKTVGNVKIGIAETKAKLFSELKDSGLSYNPKTNKLTSFQGSKFAADEVKMLNDFVKGVNKLGDNPTVSQIDNFISKTRSDLAFTKGKAGVIGTTNAERIINGQIARLRATLDPAVNGNNALSTYWNANKTYAELSDFVEEGSTFLGKKTLSGDFAKDASVAKSSVQSILNQGKKDFMIKLEALTGYKAIDDAVLALQAMKDAGDFRGLSLLQAMSETGIPTSQTGITQKILDYALSKGGEFIAGTPEQQTRALLQSLENSAVKPNTVKPTSSTTPTTGAKINKSSQPKSSKTVIPPKSTTKGLKVKGEIPTTNLVSEAKKYKSAEEFVKAQGTPIYRGGNTSLPAFDKTKNIRGVYGQASYVSENKTLTKNYGATMTEGFISPNAKILDLSNTMSKLEIQNIAKELGYSGVPKNIYGEAYSSQIKNPFDALISYVGRFEPKGTEVKTTDFLVKKLQDIGYDGVKLTQNGQKTYAIYNDSVLKTKSQLTDIWKKANKK